MTINKNDPRLTAYVLGELEEKDRLEIGAAIEESTELQQEVEELRGTAGMLAEVFAGVETTLSPDQISQIESAIELPAPQRGAYSYGWWLKIAALLLLFVGLPILIGPVVMNRLARTSDDVARVDEEEESLYYAPSIQLRLPTATEPEPTAQIVTSRDTASSAEGRAGEREDAALVRHSQVAGQTQGRNELSQRLNDQLAAGVRKDLAKSLPTVERSLVDNLELRAPVPTAVEGSKVEQPPQNGRKRMDLAVRAEFSVKTSPAAARGKLQVVRLDPNQFHTPTVASSFQDTDDDSRLRPARPFNTEGYDRIVENELKRVLDNPLSTFSIDVDTASYANVRRFIQQGILPPPDAVRIEELVNYFNYEYPQPTDQHPFSVNLEAVSAPWKPEHRLLRIGLKGRKLQGDRPALNLVFLLDVSGSMRPANKLPLLRQAMKLLVDRLRAQDRVAIVVYAGASGLVLPSTGGNQKAQILNALDRLQAGGSTHGAAGIELAYSVAESNRIEGGVNRVILATDGDFNVGVTDRGSLTRMIEEKAKKGVFLSVLGFGMGNLKDSMLEQLADKGNGNYGYIDTIREARKLLVEQMDGTLITIAKDVKIQVEFNPSQVLAYRLIGYENRALANEDFNDDKKDAGEIGAGHTVTALYEIVPVGGRIPTAGVDPLKYQQPTRTLSAAAQSGELLTLKLRYKQPDGDTSQLLQVPFVDDGRNWTAASRDFKFAAAVASFGMILRGSLHKGSATLSGVLELAQESGTLDAQGYRSEFLQIVRAAQRLGAQ